MPFVGFPNREYLQRWRIVDPMRKHPHSQPNGVRAHREPSYRIDPGISCRLLFANQRMHRLADQPGASGIQRGEPAIEVIIAPGT